MSYPSFSYTSDLSSSDLSSPAYNNSYYNDQQRLFDKHKQCSEMAKATGMLTYSPIREGVEIQFLDRTGRLRSYSEVYRMWQDTNWSKVVPTPSPMPRQVPPTLDCQPSGTIGDIEKDIQKEYDVRLIKRQTELQKPKVVQPKPTRKDSPVYARLYQNKRKST